MQMYKPLHEILKKTLPQKQLSHDGAPECRDLGHSHRLLEDVTERKREENGSGREEEGEDKRTADADRNTSLKSGQRREGG